MNDIPTTPVHFLLVDDLEENILALEALLRRKDLVLLKARSGPEALELLLKYEVALALIDINMPGMDGFELAELMRGAERTRRVPIIFLTAGSADRQRRFRGYEAGAVDFLHKPIEPDILKSKTDVFFELYRQRQEVAWQRDELKAAMAENARLLAESRQHAQALQDADRRKDEFLATLAHELRNPLAPISNAIQILQMESAADPDAQRLQQIIGRQLDQLVRLVDDLLDMSRISRDKLKLQHDTLNVADILQNAIETSRPLIESGGHHLSVALPEETERVEGDMVRLTQVVANLLNNAAKYTPDGGQIWISAAREGNEVAIRVRDSGLGIPAEMLDKVFEMFTQVNRHLQRSQGGLGIGLALVSRLVQLHGGRIEVKSEGEGKGSEFIVRLPLKEHAAPDQPTEQASNSQPSTMSAVRRVLVADDNMDSAETLRILLSMNGHQVRTAYDGQTAVEQVARFQPDLVLLDLEMPGLNGYQAAQKMRELPGGKEIILVALTGLGQEEDRRRTKEAGFDYHLVKPIRPAALEDLLTTLSGQ